MANGRDDNCWFGVVGSFLNVDDDDPWVDDFDGIVNGRCKQKKIELFTILYNLEHKGVHN